MRVDIGDGAEVGCWQLARAVANAVYPDRRSVRGPSLITHKRVRAAWNPEGWERKALSSADVATLEGAAMSLPEIHPGMDEAEVSTFARAWESIFKTELSPYWEPVIPTDADLYGERVQHLELLERSLASMRLLIEQGKLKAWSNHLPSSGLDPEAKVSRETALEYLDWIHMEAAAPKARSLNTAPGVKLAPSGQAGSAGADCAVDLAAGAAAPESSQNGLDVRWTPDAVLEAREFKAEHTWPETEEKFGCSRARLQFVFKREDARLASERGR